jgi:UDP-glucose 4-epimerase
VDDVILVTGGAGFIGSHLVDALLRTGWDVRVLDDFSTGKPENLRGAEALAATHGGSFQLIAGDVRDEDKVQEAVDGCLAVCHLAAVASVAGSVADPVGTGSVTHGGTVNVVRWAVDADVPRVVLASSSAVYGDDAELPVAETATPRPMSPYAEAKLASEQVCAAAADAGQLTAACLRFFNVYGPRQDPSSEYSGVISRFLAAAARGEGVTVFGDGAQTRDFVYVRDVVRAMLRALERPTSGVAVVNVGSGVATSVLDVLGHAEQAAGRPIPRRHEAARAGEIRHSRADTGRAAWVLGWEASRTFAEGLAETWDWYKGTDEGAGRA